MKQILSILLGIIVGFSINGLINSLAQELPSNYLLLQIAVLFLALVLIMVNIVCTNDED